MKLRDVVMGANASMYKRIDFKRIRGAFYPKTEEDVRAAIEYARKNNYEVTPKGAGTGLSGACTGGNRRDESLWQSQFPFQCLVSGRRDSRILTESMGWPHPLS